MLSRRALRPSRAALLCPITLAALCSSSVARADEPPAALGPLDAYVRAPDESFRWKVDSESAVPGLATLYNVRLTSQTWHGIVWEHWLTVVVPAEVKHADRGLLIIAGGSTRSKPVSLTSAEGMTAAQIAQSTGSVVSVLKQVPNEPILDGLSEDALIAHTFVKYMETQDATWPCLLPMTKSAVRALDTVQALLKEKRSQDLREFVVTGASKRGWTTWLTGAVDSRVIAIAPMVIDTLHMQEQMKLQVKSFGKPSEQIEDYTSRGLDKQLDQPQAQKLREIIDPYYYIPRLEKPKLIVLGTNDRYWPVDAIKLYFDDLKGEKLIHYVPNAGHGLGPGAVEAIAEFYDAVINGRARPGFTWKTTRQKDGATLSIAVQDKPHQVQLWLADAPTRDFRDSKWSQRPAGAEADGSYDLRIETPEQGFRAFHARLEYVGKLGKPYALSTNVEVLGDDR